MVTSTNFIHRLKCYTYSRNQAPGGLTDHARYEIKKEEVELPFLASNEAINRKTQASVNLNMTQVSVERNNQWLVVNHQATHTEPANILFYLSDSEKVGKISSQQ